MFRQTVNLVHYGRLRTTAPTCRRRKPAFLRRHAGLEIHNLLGFVVAHYGKPHRDFFFVQIGAFDGRVGDPLFELVAKHHWRGVLVEPQRHAFDRLKENYAAEKQLQFFNVAIGLEDGELTLYTRKSGDVSVASVTKHLLIKPGHRRADVVACQVPCWTLATLLEQAGRPDHVDLLQIDTEGFDYQIIRSIDFASLKPSIIRYEHTLFSERDRNACLELLANQGYRFLLEDNDTMALLGQQQQARVA